MEKIIVKEVVSVYINWFDGVEISQIEKDLKLFKELDITYIDISLDKNYGSDITCYKERIETDKEFNKRCEIEFYRSEKQKEKDLATLKALKEKYENNTTTNSNTSIH